MSGGLAEGQRFRHFPDRNAFYDALFAEMRGIDRDNPDSEVCAGCGKVAVGVARIGDKRYCHGVMVTPTCFELASS